MQYLDEKRVPVLETLVGCVSDLRKELLKRIPPDVLARELFMEHLSACLDKDPDSPIDEEMVTNSLAVIGASVLLVHICTHGSPDEFDIIRDALKYSAADKIVEHRIPLTE